LKARKLTIIPAVITALGMGTMLIGVTAPAASASTGAPTGYNFDGTAHIVVGGGSDTTWRVLLNLSTDYNISPGCPNTPPSSLPPNAQLDICTTPLPTTNTLGNYDHDTVSQAYPTGSSAGIAALNQDQGTVPEADCYSGGAVVQGLNDPTACGSASNARFVSDGATTAGSATLTSTTAGFSASDVGKAVRGETAIPSGETITSVTDSTTAVMSSPATSTASGVVLEIGAAGPSIDFARSSRAAKTSGGNCVGGNELTCDTFWGFAEDGVQVDEFNDSTCLGNFTFADLLSIWNGTTTTWGALNSLDSGTNALCVSGRSASDPIVPWGMNTASGTFATFQTFISASSPVPSKAGTDQALHDSSSDFPFENDIKPIVNDVANFGIPNPVGGATACTAGLSSSLSSPCDPDNWLWWSSFGVFNVFSYESSFTVGGTTVTAFPADVNGKIPSKTNIFAGTYSMDRTLYHVTKKADATCPLNGSVCNFTGNPGPAIGSGTTACGSGTTGASCDLNVIGAPGADGVSGAVAEFTRFLCRPNAADQAIDPFTGVNYDSVITNDIGGSGFTKVPTTLATAGSRCHVVPA
jgi:hypothetical protein